MVVCMWCLNFSKYHEGNATAIFNLKSIFLPIDKIIEPMIVSESYVSNDLYSANKLYREKAPHELNLIWL